MRSILSIVTIIFCSSVQAQTAGGFRINANASYVFSDQVDSYYSNTSYYNGKVQDGFQWGVGLEYMLRPDQGIEVKYLREDTKAPTEYYDPGSLLDPIKFKEFDLAINYIFLGTTHYFQFNPKIEPYVGLQGGLGIFNVSNPTTGNGTDATKFSWGLQGGAHFWLSDHLGLKLQAGLQSAVQAVGGGLYFGTGGVGTGLSSYSTIYQFSIGSGIVYRR